MKTQKVTRGLFWVAFGVFLAVSIPHVAWVFRAYEPQGTNGFDGVWWPLAYGFALAIDAVIAWLSHIKSTGEKAGDMWEAWLFIGALVAMSWYFNWIYALAHDPANPGRDVWAIVLIGQWGVMPALTVGKLTPLIISALPVFIIAYTYMLSKLAHAKAVAAKSVEELEAEAHEAQRRAQAQRRIEEARKHSRLSLIQRAAGAAKEAKQGLQALRAETEEHADMVDRVVQRVVDFFRDTPELLAEEQAGTTDAMIKELLQLKHLEAARMWRIKAAAVLAQEVNQESGIDSHQSGHVAVREGTVERTEAVLPSEPHTEHVVAATLDSTAVDVAQAIGASTEQDRGKPVGEAVAAGSMSVLDRGRGTVSIEEAAALLKYSVKYVRELRSKGVLKTASRNKDRITMRSIHAVLQARQKASQHGADRLSHVKEMHASNVGS